MVHLIRKMESEMADLPTNNLKMLTLVTPEGRLELSLADGPVTPPTADQVVVKVLAAPINPSDLGLLVGAADMSTARATHKNGHPAVEADIPPAGMRAMAGRVGEAMPIGNEASGLVIAAGDSPEAQALVGKMVAVLGGAMYSQYRTLPVQMCMPLPDGTDARDGASCFVNPLTALGFVETVRREGHVGLVHTAAASNLGQMLNRICLADAMPLINVVRSQAQVDLLKGQGAQYVFDSSKENFADDLTTALVETGITCAFDAIGGGKLGSLIMSCMEAAAVKRMKEYSRYGSDTFKQLYIYGGLDMSPTVMTRSFGFQWSVSGWLLTPFMQKAGPEVVLAMRARVVAELTTTFASHYSHEISLDEALNLETLHAYNAKRTGDKYLVLPHKGA
jgi:NADPH:quinone reductase-like Zn-dependent oxidoreductase